jgi:hypothetical protein
VNVSYIRIAVAAMLDWIIHELSGLLLLLLEASA